MIQSIHFNHPKVFVGWDFRGSWKTFITLGELRLSPLLVSWDWSLMCPEGAQPVSCWSFPVPWMVNPNGNPSQQEDIIHPEKWRWNITMEVDGRWCSFFWSEWFSRFPVNFLGCYELRSDQVMQRGDVFVFVVWIMSSKNERFVHFLVSFHLGAWYFFILQTQLSPLVLDRPFGASPDPGPFMELTRHESPRKPCDKKGALTVPRVFGADVKDKNLVKKLMIPTSLGPWDAGRWWFFCFGKTDYFVKNRCWQWKLEPFWVRARMLFMVLICFNNCSQRDYSSLSKCWRKGFKKLDLHQIFLKIHIIIYTQKLAQWYCGKLIFVGQTSRFFFWFEKNTIPVWANKLRPPFALKPSFGTRWIGRRNTEGVMEWSWLELVGSCWEVTPS